MSAARAKRRKLSGGYLGVRHPLADVARRRCDDQHGWARTALLGGIACGRCWEFVIRMDERVAVEHQLPDVDPVEAATWLDDVAIERAIRGERIKLTPAERVEAARRLAERGATNTAISRRLGMSQERVNTLLSALPVAAGVEEAA